MAPPRSRLRTTLPTPALCGLWWRAYSFIASKSGERISLRTFSNFIKCRNVGAAPWLSLPDNKGYKEAVEQESPFQQLNRLLVALYSSTVLRAELADTLTHLSAPHTY